MTGYLLLLKPVESSISIGAFPSELLTALRFFRESSMTSSQATNLRHTYAYLDNITIGGHNQDAHDRNLQMFVEATKKVNLTFNESKSVLSTSRINILGYEISSGLIRPDPERPRPLTELPLPQNSKELKRCLGWFAYYAR